MQTILNRGYFWVLLAVPIAIIGCRPASIEPAADVTASATELARPSAEPALAVATQAPATQTIRVPDVRAPTPESETSLPQPSPSAKPEHVGTSGEGGTRYQVVFVEADDVLNVRSGPGAQNSIVGTLAPGTGDVRASGSPEQVSGSPWLPIAASDVAGWVNRRFLTEQMESGEFCRASEVTHLADALKEAVAKRDGDLLAGLVDPQAGLRINRHWWNPTVHVAQEDIAQLFTGSESYHWGIADGTGDSIDGTFGDIIVPLLDRNLLPASEFGCDEIIHGGTAGFVNIPLPYQGIHFISLHRPPASDGFELDWGTWVAGIERRQGDYYLSYLVHYEWEI
jgi:hypothetical protein